MLAKEIFEVTEENSEVESCLKISIVFLEKCYMRNNKGKPHKSILSY